MDRRTESLAPINREMFHHVDHITQATLPVILGIANGWNNPTIAAVLGRSEQAIKNTTKQVYDRLGIHDSRSHNQRVLLAWWYWNIGVAVPVKDNGSRT